MIKSFIIYTFLILFLSGTALCQNIVTIADITEMKNIDDSSSFRLYRVSISPGYKDNAYRVDVESKDGKILYSSEINIRLLVHKKNFKMPDSNKVEWDYETEIKSNDILNDGTLELNDCSNKRHLIFILRPESTSVYKIILYHKEYGAYEQLLTFETDK